MILEFPRDDYHCQKKSGTKWDPYAILIKMLNVQFKFSYYFYNNLKFKMFIS